ncbi:MAG: hypothetical protein WAQ27_01050 [Candidatus Microsaccharimonas sp.]
MQTIQPLNSDIEPQSDIPPSISTTDSTPEQTEPPIQIIHKEKPESLAKILLNFFGKYFIGLLLSALFGLILGVIFGSNLFSSEAVKFAEIEDTIRIILFIIPLTIIFWFVGLGVNNKLIALYPIVAYIIGVNYGVPSGISFYLPEPVNDVSIQVMIAYIMAHAFVWPISKMIYYGKNSFTPYRNVLIWMSTFCFFILVPVIGSTLLFGTQKITAVAVRTMATVHIINEPDLYAKFSTQTKATDNPEMVLYYTGQATSDNGRLELFTDIQNKSLQKAWLKNTPTACTSGEEKQTKSGTAYRESIEERYISNVKVPSNARTYYTYCFTVDYTTYKLTQSNAIGLATMEQYPIERIIDSFKNGPTVNVLCAQGISKDDYLTTNKSLCTDEERTTWQAMISTNTGNYRNSQSGSSDGSLYVPLNAYTQVSWLEIPELSIKLPLSEEVKNSSYRVEAEYYYVTLSDVAEPSCSRSDSTPTKDYELGYLKQLDAQQIANSTSLSEYPIINNIKYRYGSNHCKFNAAAANLTEEQLAQFDSLFKWMVANGQPLTQ